METEKYTHKTRESFLPYRKKQPIGQANVQHGGGKFLAYFRFETYLEKKQEGYVYSY